MLIHLEKLGKTFGEKVVLHDVTASVEREDRIGIVGQNGAGKTTLLKILTGEYQDYEGEFSVTHGVTLGYLEQNAKLDATLDIYGEMRSCFAHVLDAMAQMQILERRMAASPEDASLLEQHDALQNIIDAADGYNMDVNIKKVLSGMGFAQDTWTKNIAVLSGGELTRLRLAKLLLEKPDVLILDEPTNGLDPIGIAEVRNFIKDLSTEHGKTILISSHILSEIELLADDIGIIDHGILLEESSMDELQRKNSKYILLQVSEVSKALLILERQFGVKDYSVQDEQTLRLYDTTLDMAAINKALVTQEVSVISSGLCNDTLEDYFKKITGGEGIA